MDLSELVNEMLKKEIEIIEAAGNRGVTSRIYKKLKFQDQPAFILGGAFVFAWVFFTLLNRKESKVSDE